MNDNTDKPIKKRTAAHASRDDTVSCLSETTSHILTLMPYTLLQTALWHSCATYTAYGV